VIAAGVVIHAADGHIVGADDVRQIAFQTGIALADQTQGRGQMRRMGPLGLGQAVVQKSDRQAGDLGVRIGGVRGGGGHGQAIAAEAQRLNPARKFKVIKG